MISKSGLKGRLVVAVFSVVFLWANAVTAAEAPATFSKAKKVIQKEVYYDHPETFYCGCDYQSELKEGSKTKTKLTPNWQSCGYTPRKNAKRAARIEWEHVMPAWEFGHQLQCWQDGGRKNCRKDPTFRRMEADLMNLVPAIGEVNGDRSNFRFNMLSGEPRVYGTCDVEIDFKQRVAEPAPHIRGDVARIYFYMSDKYGIKLSRKQKQLFQAWAKQDPVDEWEAERKRRIEILMGVSP
ncbi:MAG: endonuclease [Pontibacterium sp.]